MVFLLFVVGDHIILKCLNFCKHYVMEQSLHFELIGCPYILYSKWHEFITISSPRYDKNGIFFIFFYHLDLFIPQKSIHEVIHEILGNINHVNIDMRYEKIIIGTCYVQILKVNTHSDLVIFL